MQKTWSPWKIDSDALVGARVLVVEDDFFQIIELESVLIDAGAEIAGLCRKVSEALAVINDGGSATAAILDVRLGNEEIGPVVRELVRRKIPFVFYTGQIANDPALAEWPGCKIVAKPAHPGAIVAAIAAMMKH